MINSELSFRFLWVCVHAAAYETRGTSHVFSTCCGLALTAGSPESCSGVMLPSLLLLLLQLLVLVALGDVCAPCVRLSAILSPFPSLANPAVGGSGYCAVCSSSIPTSSPHSSTPHSPRQTPKPLHPHQDTHWGSGSAAKANMLPHYMEMVDVVRLEPVEFKCKSSRL